MNTKARKAAVFNSGRDAYSRALVGWRVTMEHLRKSNKKLLLLRREYDEFRRLKENERLLYKELFEMAPDGYLVTDVLGTVSKANAAACRILNLSWNELFDKELVECVAEEDRPTFQKIIHELNDAGSFEGMELRLHPHRQPPIPVWLTVASGHVPNSKLVQLKWQLRDISERKRAEIAIQNSLAREIDIREQRDHILRDLHDNVIQSIYAIGLTLEEGHGLLKQDRSNETSELMLRMIESLNGVIRDVRAHLDLGANKLPAVPAKQLNLALKELASRTGGSRHHIDVHVENRAVRLLTDEDATEIFSIAQEAASNSVRHARAKSRMMNMRVHNGHVLFEFKDDGVGFNPAKAKKKGQGLHNMKTRAAEQGWRFRIFSNRDAWTGVAIEIPYGSPPPRKTLSLQA